MKAKITLREDEIIKAIRDYLERQGYKVIENPDIIITSGSIDGPYHSPASVKSEILIDVNLVKANPVA